MPEEEQEAGQGEGRDGGASFDAVASIECPVEREQPAGQERLELPRLLDEDAQALAQAYREAAAEMMDDPLFDLDSGHGLNLNDA